jgi:hypothetical protein
MSEDSTTDNSQKLLDFLSSFEDYSEETLEAERREAEAMDALAVELEEKFPELGLRFTKTFAGGMPVQAYGWILGERFYFRYRSDIASLTVGTVNAERAEAEFERKVARYLDLQNTMPSFYTPEFSEKYQTREDVIAGFNLAVQTDFSQTAFPDDVSFRVSLGGFAGDPWAGVLSPEDAKEVFIQLIELLVAERALKGWEQS